MRAPRPRGAGPTVAVAIITFNAEELIGDCLESVQWADEIILVDAESSDRTAEVATPLADQVVRRAWAGFSEQKNFAASLTGCDWILHLDADERVSPALGEEMRRAVASPGEQVAFFMPRQNFWLGRWIRHGGWYPDWSLRLYRRGAGQWEGITHERLVVRGALGHLKEPLQHYTYRSVQAHVERMILRSAPLEAREAVEQGVRIYRVFPVRVVFAVVRSWLSGPPTPLRLRLLYKEHIKNRVEIAWLLPFMPMLRFWYMYVFRLGFLDGYAGFWVAALSSFYEVVRLAKIWEHFHAGNAGAGMVDRRPVWDQSVGRV
jgi:glycosyltransferase involved in cell wall biosynthesis